jgi:hypothetical protein
MTPARRQNTPGRSTRPAPTSPQAKRRQRSAKAAVRRDTTLLQSETPRRIESRMAPPRYTERRQAKPGAGIKRARGVMVPKQR